jgi:hypothetical protein
MKLEVKEGLEVSSAVYASAWAQIMIRCLPNYRNKKGRGSVNLLIEIVVRESTTPIF